MPSQKVIFQGNVGWFIPNSEIESTSGPIAPEHHCDNDGNLEALDGENSLGHVFNGIVMVYGKVVGTLEDLLANKL